MQIAAEITMVLIRKRNWEQSMVNPMTLKELTERAHFFGVKVKRRRKQDYQHGLVHSVCQGAQLI